MKFCPKCKTEKPLTGFHKCRTRKDGLACWCKVCSGINGHNWLKKNPEKRRERGEKTRLRGLRADVQARRRITDLKRKYNLTESEYAARLAAQNDKCAICQDILCVTNIDHDHETGKVRGILCNLCNQGLGSFRDSEAALLGAIEYLRKNK